MKAKQALIIFSFILLSATSLTYTSPFEKECMTGISLSDLREKYNARLLVFKNTDASKKVSIHQKQFREKSAAHSIVFSKCQCYKSSTTGWCAWINGCNEKDCQESEQYYQEMSMAQQRFQYALFRAKESDPEFVELMECILEREYNELPVAPSVETK